MIYDVLIIGAGCTGVMTARYLSQYTLKVALVESNYDVATGTTGANSAIVHAGYDAKPDTLKAKLNVRGNNLMKSLAKQLGVELKNIGSHVIGFGDEDMPKLRELLDRGMKNGVEGLEIISQDKLLQMEPNISRKARASLYAPTAAITCPYGITIAAAENAVTNGVDLYLGFKVNNSFMSDGIHYITNQDGNATLAAKYVVNCAGVNSVKIAKILGENKFPIHIIPRRGEYYILDKTAGKLANSTLFVCPTEKGKGILVSPTVDGNIIVGPNAYPIEDSSDTSTTSAGLAEITAGARLLIPTINMCDAITTFAGVRPTPDIYDFYLKNSEQLPGVVHAVGMESPGFASSPAVAEYLVNLLRDAGLKTVEKDYYIPTRRADGNHKQFNKMTKEEKAEACRKNPAYGKIICRCETVTEGDILDAMDSPIPADTVDMIKKRLRAGMGRCQGGFCSPRVVSIIAEKTGRTIDEVTKSGGKSWITIKKY